MKTFSTVEDYLEVISGKRQLDGKLPVNQLSWAGLGYDFKPIISLARYDVNFLDSVTDGTLGGNSLTDRQAELAIKIVGKYTRQLHAQGVDIGTILERPVYRKPLRMIDRRRMVELNDGEIWVRFSFDQKLIEYIRENSKDSQGRVRFDKEQRAWRIAYTEYNLNWVMVLAQTHEFEVDPALKTTLQSIMDCESSGFNIQLETYGDHLFINNAPTSMLEHLGNTRNHFDREDAAKVADWAEVLGFTVHPDVEQLFTDTHGSSMAIMIRHRSYDFKEHNWHGLEQDIYRYAQLVNRFPIVVFDPQSNFGAWEEIVDADRVINLSKHRASDDRQVCQNSNAEVILTNRAIKYLDRIPLLVSNMGMLVGQDKRIMTDASEKVFYRNGRLA